MPIYEYQCKSCGHQLEAFQSFSDAPLTACPECKQQALTKLISSTSFQLKGTGWYVTDTRDKGKPKPKEGEENKGSSSDTAGTADTPSKDQSAGGKAE